MDTIALPWLDRWKNDEPFLFDDYRLHWLTAGEVATAARKVAATLPNAKQLIFLYAANRIETVTALMGAIGAGHAVALLDPLLGAEARAELERIYTPNITIDTHGACTLEVQHRERLALHGDLALLLSTSGSTGSPKLVRLTLGNLLANAEAIASVQELQAGDVAAGHLPLHYSFGLSVLTSHAHAAAPVRLTELGFTDRAFWTEMKKAGVTHLPGVPFHFQILQRLGYQRLDLPSLRILAQAGGHLELSGREIAYRAMEERGGRFYVMYGQTEAAPRIATLSHGDFPCAPESVGRVLPGGRIDIVAPDANGQGEVLYSGPNVMMGYAETVHDLAKGDELGGKLATGDIGRIDAEGRLILSGRAKRFGKVYGLRVNLDDVERKLGRYFSCAVIQEGDNIHIFYVNNNNDDDRDITSEMIGILKESFNIPQICYRFTAVMDLPVTDRGKIDYQNLGGKR